MLDVKRWIYSAGCCRGGAPVVADRALHAALPTEPDISGRTSFAGQLLIAAPEMREPFDHAVVLMAQHNRDGALGIIINRPLDSRPIASVLQSARRGCKRGRPAVCGSISAVRSAPEVAFVLHSADYQRPDSVDIDGRVALSKAADVLRDIGLGKGPNKSLVAFGYAGWAPSQLEDELAARRLGHGAGGSGAGIRRRSHEGVDRRAGAA